jgi:hypothetical protein
MSQAHYVLCDNQAVHPPYAGPIPPAVAAVRHPNGTDWCFCLDCLNETLDHADAFPNFEPLYLVWAWDAGTRSCPLHHWPDVLCRDWAAEHAAMIRALTAPALVPATRE